MGVPIATGALKTMRTNVVASGLTPSPQIDADFLNMTPEQANDLQTQIVREFSLWADSPLCDADRVDNFYKLQQLAFLAYMMNGDAFAVLPMRHSVGQPYDLRVQLSYVLRYLLSLQQVRRGAGTRLVREIVCYADDFVIIGHASQLMKAMKKATRWAKSTLGLGLKRAWQQVRFASFEEEKRMKAARVLGSKHRTPALDMMGFAVRRTYTIVRKGVFRRIRRQLIRAGRDLALLGYVPHWRSSQA